MANTPQERVPYRRLPVIDIWRGLAVIGMILYHFAFLMADWGMNTSIFFHPLTRWMGHFVRTSFLFLVGVSLSLSYWKDHKKNFSQRQFKRFVVIFFAALLVSAGSYIYQAERFIYFGILHSIAFGVLFLHPLVKFPNKSFVIAFIMLVATPFLMKTEFTNPLLSILFRNKAMGINPLDHFAIFPSWSAILLGISFGYLISLSERRAVLFSNDSKKMGWAKYCGKHALLIYILHGPALFVVFLGIQLLSN